MDFREGSISDGRASISFLDLQTAKSSWDAWLQRSGISLRECLALSTQTDARSAVALLSLIHRGQSVLLWRQPIAVEDDRLVPGTLPSFCRAALVPSPSGASAGGPDGFRLVRSSEHSASSPKPDAPYVYLPTSGTTGQPKIVAYEPNKLLSNAANCVERLRLSRADRVMIPVPLAHMYGLGAALLPAMHVGASVRLIPEANLLNYVQAENEFDPTVAFVTPTFCHLLVKGRKQARLYRLTVLAGDEVDPKTFAAYEQRHGCTVNLYGSTELGVISAGSPEETFQDRLASAGTPLPGLLLDQPGLDAVASAPREQPFALRFRHPYGCAGYADDHGHPSKPPSLFKDGWYFTRDMGRVDDAGRLQLAGRFDDSIKRDGFLVAFADVERALQRLDFIERAVVISGGLTPRGRELVAVCTITPGVVVDPAHLRRLALGLLPGHAVPDRFVFVDKLPLTSTAKPDRSALAEMVF